MEQALRTGGLNTKPSSGSQWKSCPSVKGLFNGEVRAVDMGQRCVPQFRGRLQTVSNALLRGGAWSQVIVVQEQIVEVNWVMHHLSLEAFIMTQRLQ